MRADRLFSIVLLLQTRGRMTAQQLSDELQVSERTLYRDLDSLSLAGIPIYADKGPGGGYALLEGYRTSLTSLTETEASTLFMSAVPEPLAQLGLEQTLKGALLKLLAALPLARRKRIENERSRIHLDPAAWWQKEDEVPFLPVIQQALWDNMRVKILYDKGGDAPAERIIEPYGLVAKTSWWYVVANTPGGLRVYRVSRILEATLTDETFERPDDFDLPAYWKQSRIEFETSRPQYMVNVRLAPQIFEYIYDHYGVETREMLEAAIPDEHGWRETTLRYERFEWALNAVLGMGEFIEVLGPAELRTRVGLAVQKMAKIYA